MPQNHVTPEELGEIIQIRCLMLRRRFIVIVFCWNLPYQTSTAIVRVCNRSADSLTMDPSTEVNPACTSCVPSRCPQPTGCIWIEGYLKTSFGWVWKKLNSINANLIFRWKTSRKFQDTLENQTSSWNKILPYYY